jgi:hypothetical protein
VVPEPVLGLVVLGIAVHLHTAELFLIAEGKRGVVPLLHIIVDLRTDLPWRIRRRAMYRRRRRWRQRYRAPRRHGQPFKVRRPSLARSTWGSHLRQHHVTISSISAYSCSSVNTAPILGVRATPLRCQTTSSSPAHWPDTGRSGGETGACPPGPREQSGNGPPGALS